MPREPKCSIYGHEHQTARTCTACRTEYLFHGTWPTGTRHQDAHHNEPEPYEDAKTRAAGGDR